MSTRAVLGFAVDGEDKIGYNPANSYPAGLGEEILTWLRSSDLNKVKEKARSLELVSPETTPNNEQLSKYKRFARKRNPGGSLENWHCLLRDLQGDLEETLEAGIMIDGIDALEAVHYGYVIDFDANVFEVYGVSHEPNRYGRFPRRRLAGIGETKFIYPMSLLATYPLNDLPENLSALDE